VATRPRLPGDWRKRRNAFVDERIEKQLLDKTDSIGDNLEMAKKRTKSKKLTDQLRQAIDDSGMTRYRIAQETGISEATLSKFYLGQRGLSMEALNALGEYLQLTIHLGRKPEQKGK
jgi:DNA-binding Xre family transcriptional regulator